MTIGRIVGSAGRTDGTGGVAGTWKGGAPLTLSDQGMPPR
jgi:hypothetical protein